MWPLLTIKYHNICLLNFFQQTDQYFTNHSYICTKPLNKLQCISKHALRIPSFNEKRSLIRTKRDMCLMVYAGLIRESPHQSN